MLKYVLLNWLVLIEPRYLELIPDDLKTQEISNKAVEKVPWLLQYVPVHFRAPGMCFKVVEKCLHLLRFIPDHLKTQEMCEKAVKKEPISTGWFIWLF